MSLNAVPKEEVAVQTQPDSRVGFIGYCRAATRFVLILFWLFFCYVAVRIAGLVGAKAKRKVGSLWISGTARLLGQRIKVKGAPPRHPYFLVSNHLCWLDMFAGLQIIHARPIVEDPIRTLPILGPLVSSLNPIYVRRCKEDTPRVYKLMVESLKRGESIVLAPENPKTEIPLGSGIRMFRAGLIGSAIEADVPAHFMCLNYRTPEGWPSPKKALMFGPNPLYTDKDGKVPESEIAAHGGQHSFFQHAVGVLALPWHEISITFGDRPITATDRIALANNLHRAVSRHFNPLC